MDSQSISSSSASFYEPPFKYSEENTMLLYKSIKMNVQEIQKYTKEVDTKLKNIQGDISTTAALLSAIEKKPSTSGT